MLKKTLENTVKIIITRITIISMVMTTLDMKGYLSYPSHYCHQTGNHQNYHHLNYYISQKTVIIIMIFVINSPIITTINLS